MWSETTKETIRILRKPMKYYCGVLGFCLGYDNPINKNNDNRVITTMITAALGYRYPLVTIGGFVAYNLNLNKF